MPNPSELERQAEPPGGWTTNRAALEDETLYLVAHLDAVLRDGVFVAGKVELARGWWVKDRGLVGCAFHPVPPFVLRREEADHA